MSGRLFLGIDEGSGSVRAGIFDAALLGAAACGAFASMPAAADDMVRPGGSVAARREAKAFHDAKYAIYLQLYEDMERCRSAMSAWQ
jgi:ribulose kinase